MIAWLGYSTAIGMLLVVAAAVLEGSTVLRGRARLAWVASMATTLGLTILPLANPTPVATGVPALDSGIDAVLMVAWVAVSAATLCILLMSSLRVASMRRRWRERVIAGVPVLVSHDVGPAVIGLVHHGIVVPSWVEGLDEDAQRTVMTHEREHVRAGDPLLLWLGTLLVALAPWNVPMWYALRRLRHAIEIDCDARVLRSRPDTRAYCALLLDVGERTLAGVAPIAALAEPATLLERRIEAMTSRERPSSPRMAAAALAALSLVSVACWTPRAHLTPRHSIGLLVAGDRSAEIPSERERALETSAHLRWEEELEPRIDVAIAQVFPEIHGKREKSPRMLTLTYDYVGRLRAHSIGPMFEVETYHAPDFSNVQIQIFAMRTIDSLHATAAIVREKWNVDGEPRVSAYGGRRGPAHSRNVPAHRQFARRVDSLARVDFSDAYLGRDGGMAVLVVFDQQGRVLRTFSRRMPIDELFERLPRMPFGGQQSVQAASRILARLLPTGIDGLTSYGAQTLHDTPDAVLLFAEVPAQSIR